MKLTVQNVKRGEKSFSITCAEGEYKANFKVSGIEQAAGKIIDADIEENEFKGKVYRWIRSFSVIENVPVSVMTGIQPYWWPSVSNVWAHCIDMGIIKEPSDLKMWALAVRAAAEAAEEQPKDLDDEIPY